MQSRVFQYSNAIVRVHIPDVADKEKHLKEITNAAKRLLKEVIRSEQK